MFLLFGWGKKTIKEMGTTEVVRCGNCNNVREWNYKKVTTWFTLFFIPVIPYESFYAKQCPICKAAIKIHKNEALGASSDTVSLGTNNDGLTDVQRNYRKQMVESKNEKTPIN